ncbi:alpha/beta fold hydrolase [Roseomonas sp. KE2513]|uniref:alpha/beta fold hydrolase n=1 Tax=Roseomonas sp. KE2513 TaxID=2479202 RepID=UPI0018DF1DF6|nr:alpha/beta fold hydrolase [Roseomonas sp. KE2513]MBI0534875.1 alpha/beta fold hydrolase [Roseomonas sp. KE2513]
MIHHPDGSEAPPLPETRFAELDAGALGLEHGRISFMEGGEGPEAVLLMHGIGSNSTGWRFVLPALARRARVIAWNAPGYWLSADFAAEAPAATDYARAAVALLDALGIGRAHVVGSSFGSMVGAVMAAEHPARVGRLALLGASRGQRWKPEAERARMLAMRAESVAEGGMALARKRWSNLVAPGTPEVVAEWVRQSLAATHAKGLMRSARASDATDTTDFAPRIRAPTLVLVGSEDRVNPPEVSRVLAAAIPGAVLAVQPGIGHQAKLEAPADTVARLERHLF